MYKTKLDQNNNIFDIDYIEIEPEEKICKDLGVFYQVEFTADDILGSINSALKKNRPVIVWVDCYYESIRKDTYLKEHRPHTLLIYGYDENEKNYTILEHDHSEKLS
ncbi:BtrH N-terminal domain-containing protein, partial [Paenibacillus gorillae]|uniref:BtrH N-terminal domain-containing protein n=1 Tax=Paenibacillus gorillae TaxID=1243662 RepID=UPI00138AE3B6